MSRTFPRSGSVTAQAATTESSSDSGRKLFELRRRAYFDPLFFFGAWLRFEYLYSWQRDLLSRIGTAIRAGAKKIKVHCRCCHGAGKTLVAAGLVQCFMYTRQEPRALTLAHSWTGVETLIWAELGRQWGRSLQGDLGWGKLLGTSLHLSKGSFAFGMSSDRPGRLEGQHSPAAAMRVVDEAKEVEPETFESTEGLLDAPESWDVWISTPSLPSGKFHDRDVEGGSDVIRVVVTVEDLIQDFKKFGYPALAGKEAWKAECLKEWGGEADSRYRSRCMAEYIHNVEGALFPMSWVERAFKIDFGPPKDRFGRWLGAPFVGMDVAGSVDGDENVVFPLQRIERDDDPKRPRVQAIANLKKWSERDTMVSKDRATGFALGLGIDSLRVDANGLGKGVHDQAKRERVLKVEEYRSTENPDNTKDYQNRKAEDGFFVRELLERGDLDLSRIVGDERALLRKQLVAMRYEELESGKKRVVDPPDSPDLAEALIIAAARSRLSVKGVARPRGIG